MADDRRFGYRLQVVGDELHMDGMVVAIFVQRGVAATLMDKLVTSLDGALVNGCADDTKVPYVKDVVGEGDRDELLARMVKAGRNGLLRVSDACMVINDFMDGV